MYRLCYARRSITVMILQGVDMYIIPFYRVMLYWRVCSLYDLVSQRLSTSPCVSPSCYANKYMFFIISPKTFNLSCDKSGLSRYLWAVKRTQVCFGEESLD